MTKPIKSEEATAVTTEGSGATASDATASSTRGRPRRSQSSGRGRRGGSTHHSRTTPYQWESARPTPPGSMNPTASSFYPTSARHSLTSQQPFDWGHAAAERLGQPTLDVGLTRSFDAASPHQGRARETALDDYLHQMDMLGARERERQAGVAHAPSAPHLPTSQPTRTDQALDAVPADEGRSTVADDYLEELKRRKERDEACRAVPWSPSEPYRPTPQPTMDTGLSLSAAPTSQAQETPMQDWQM